LTDQPRYIVKPLGNEDRVAFNCGDSDLDGYFHQRASRDVREKLSAVFILVTQDAPETILGYYTLSAQHVDASAMPEEMRKKAGRYQRLGVTLLGRLAIAKNQQGKKLGALLLVDALRRALEGTRHVMSFAVIVDAKGEHVVNFYRKFGFVPLSATRLLLPMKTIERNFRRE